MGTGKGNRRRKEKKKGLIGKWAILPRGWVTAGRRRSVSRPNSPPDPISQAPKPSQDAAFSPDAIPPFHPPATASEVVAVADHQSVCPSVKSVQQCPYQKKSPAVLVSNPAPPLRSLPPPSSTATCLIELPRTTTMTEERKGGGRHGQSWEEEKVGQYSGFS